MKRKGFTLIELLVVIAIIALLMGILMPALAKVRMLAYRLVCGTNISGIGKAMAIYASDNFDRFPRAGVAGGSWTEWNGLVRWDQAEPTKTEDRNREIAFGTKGATITASFYLLVRYQNMTPKQFICKGDDGVKEFKTTLLWRVKGTMRDFWDFGPVQRPGGQPAIAPGQFCSYSYHMPYANVNEDEYSVNEGTPESNPVIADRNPFLDLNTNFLAGFSHGDNANAFAHQREGQNVLYKDMSQMFEKSVTVGLGGALDAAGNVRGDNIWTYGNKAGTSYGGDPEGKWPTGVGDVGGPTGSKDAYLVSESNEEQ